jgi:foldase protein PrsA
VIFLNRSIRAVLSVVFLALLLAGCQTVKEGIIAEVNGIEITQEEFDIEFQVNKSRFERQFGDDALSQVGMDGKTLGETLSENILENLIIQKLIEADSEKNGITVTDEEIAASIASISDELGGEQAFQDFLDSNSFDLAYFKKYEGEQLIVGKHRELVLSGIQITEEQARDYYSQKSDSLIEVKASHILLATEEDAARVLQRLQNGEDFASVAMLESLDSESAIKGGELGYFPRGYYSISEFEEQAFAIEEGEMSGVVRTEVGYHIILVQDRLDTYEELSEKVFDTIREESYYGYIEKLRAEAEVSKYTAE